MNILLILFAVLPISSAIVFNLAVNKIAFIYNEPDKAGFALKKRTWGPSLSDTKKIAKFTPDKSIRIKANESLKLWKMGFFLLKCFGVIYIVILFLRAG